MSKFKLTAQDADLIVLRSRCTELDLTARALLREIVRTPAITLSQLFNYYDFISQAQLAAAPLSPLKPITVERFKDYIVQLRFLEIIKIAKLGDGEKAPEIADIHGDWWSDAVIQALDETPPKENAEKEVGQEALQQYEDEVSQFLFAYSKLSPHQMRSKGVLKSKKHFDNMRFEAIKELVDKTEEEKE
jgi:hypothetical protein